MSGTDDPRRRLPGVDAFLGEPGARLLLERHPRAAVLEAARAAIARRRSELAGPDGLLGEIEALLRPSLRPVLNATGVVLHTNLGRAPLAPSAAAAAAAAAGYTTLEWDPESGERGSRDDHARAHLRALTGAPASCVVNTCAGAVLLALVALASGREVVVSRGELVEIGGGFRVPEILAASGCTLVEVGTTNRTALDDYRRAIGPGTGAILHVHPSNFRVVGFTGSPPLADLAAVAREHALPFVVDLGSGAMDPGGIDGDEPGVAAAVAAGADVVCFSGDKLLGGPQCGVVVGATGAVGAMGAHPLMRALRPGKLTLAALLETLALHLDPARARREIPARRILAETDGARRLRAERLARLVGGEVVPTVGRVGGGSRPLAELASFAAALPQAPGLARRLRLGEPALATRTSRGEVLIDVLCLADEEIDLVAECVRRARE